jgi:hypothetical protein
VKRKRAYSREFPTGGVRRKLDIDWVPPSLLVSAKAKARRQGVSLRVAILRLLRTWVSEPEGR